LLIFFAFPQFALAKHSGTPDHKSIKSNLFKIIEGALPKPPPARREAATPTMRERQTSSLQHSSRQSRQRSGLHNRASSRKRSRPWSVAGEMASSIPHRRLSKS
jgi:hypothetical protein